jgi:prepilin-type N-terminal cleavage/methylation domain-containing protein
MQSKRKIKYRPYLNGFTLLEIMLVVSIIGLLIVLAIPSFMKHRQRVENIAFENDIRILLASFERMAITEGNYPPDAPAATEPPGLAGYMPRHLEWDKRNSIGGFWDWENKMTGTGEFIGLAVKNPQRTAAQMKKIDADIDDGIIHTGSFRRNGDSYVYIIIE